MDRVINESLSPTYLFYKNLELLPSAPFPFSTSIMSKTYNYIIERGNLHSTLYKLI